MKYFILLYYLLCNFNVSLLPSDVGASINPFSSVYNERELNKNGDVILLKIKQENLDAEEMKYIQSLSKLTSIYFYNTNFLESFDDLTKILKMPTLKFVEFNNTLFPINSVSILRENLLQCQKNIIVILINPVFQSADNTLRGKAERPNQK